MKFIVYIIFFTLSCFSASAQKAFTVMDWKTDVSLNAYLVQKMKAQYSQRSKLFTQAIASQAGARNYISSVQGRYRKILGKLPQKTDLKARVTGRLEREAYSIEKIVYQSTPSHFVTANLYLPKVKGASPAVLFFCGHEDLSKATETYQKTAASLAQNGFVVFVIDPISQSERHQLTSEDGRPLTRGGTTEHTILNAQLNVLGSSVPAAQLWDNVRALDYLLTRREVDGDRVACMGNSGGAIQAIYFAGFEPRIKASVINSFLMNRERTLELTGASDGCSHLPNEGAAMLEMSDFLIAAAPKPVLVMAGSYDFIDFTGAKLAFEEIQKVYAALGRKDHASFFSVEDGHGLSLPKRERAVSFLKQWLQGDKMLVKELPIETFTDKELFAASGSVSASLHDSNLVQKNLTALGSSKPRFLAGNSLMNFIQKQIGNNPAQLSEEEKQPALRNEVYYRRIILRKEGELPMPLVVAAPAQFTKIVVFLHEEGKQRIMDSMGLVKKYLDEGTVVLLADLRGMGETADQPAANDPKFFNREYRNAMLAIHVGDPLPVQRTRDIQNLLSWIRSKKEWQQLPLTIHASGATTIPALHYAAMDNKIEKLELYQSIGSFGYLISQPLVKNWYSFVIPGMLQYYDIPELLALTGGRARIHSEIKQKEEK